MQSAAAARRNQEYQRSARKQVNPLPKLPQVVKRSTYTFSSYRGDVTIDHELEEIQNPANAAQKRGLVGQLGVSIQAEEKHIPFNHKLEQFEIQLMVCDDPAEGDRGLKCQAPQEKLILHDQALFG